MRTVTRFCETVIIVEMLVHTDELGRGEIRRQPGFVLKDSAKASRRRSPLRIMPPGTK